MRLSIVGVAAAAMILAGCSSSSSSTSSSGSSGTTGQAASGSSSTTSTSGSTGHNTTGTTGTTGTTTTGTTSSGTTTTGTTGTTGRNFCTPSTASSSGSSGSTGTGTDFSCVGHAPPLPAESGPATIVLVLVDQNRNTLGAGLAVKACLETDASCANPLATGTSDATGTVVLTANLPSSGFPGFFDISGRLEYTADGGTPSNSVLPELVYYPAVKTDGGPQGIIGVRQSDADTISFATNVNLDPTRGQVIGNIADCSINNAVGAVAFTDQGPTADGGNVNMYFAPVTGFGEVPSPANPETDTTGNFIIANVVPGQTVVTGYVHATCSRIGSRTVQIRPGTITNVLVVPNQ